MAAVVEPQVFDVNQAAVYIHVSANQVRDWLKAGVIPGWRTLGPNRGDWRVSKKACDDWIALQEERGRMEVGQ
jgi:excisionase family DNA binding protein